MAKQSINEIIDPKAVEGLEKTYELLIANNKAMDELIKTTLKLKNAEGGKDYESKTKALKTLQTSEKELLDVKIKQSKLEQELVKQGQQALAVKDKQAKAAEKAAKMAADEANAYKKLSLEYKKAADNYRDLAARLAKGEIGVTKKQVDEAAKSTKNLNDQLKKIDADIGNHQRNVGNYGSAVDKLKGFVIGAVGGLLSFGAAMKAAQFVIASTNTLTDRFTEAMTAAKESLGVVGRAIANLDFKGFGDNLRAAAKAGVDYAKAMDEVEDRARGLTIQEEILKGLMLDQEKIFKDRLRTDKERAAAAAEMKRLQAELTLAAVDNTQRELKANLDLAASQSRLSQEEIKRYVIANNGSFEQIQLGEKLIDQYNAINSAAIRTGNPLLDFVANIRAGTTASKEQAETFKNSLTPAQLEAFEAAKKYGNITDEVRDKIAKNMVTSLQQTNAEKEKAVAMLRVEGTIAKSMDKTEAATRKATGATVEHAKARQAEADALQPVLDLLIKMGYDYDQVSAFQKRLTEETGKGVKNQFALRKSGKEDLDRLNKEYNDKELAKESELWSVKKQIAAEGFQTLASFEQSFFDSKAQNLANEYNDLERQKDQKLITEEQYQKGKEELDKKARKLARDKAVSDRILASAQIIYQYAMAQAEMAALSAPTLGQPWVGLLAAMQALALGAIWAAPLPKLAKGIKDSPAMFAEVGEAGPELVVSGDSSQWVTQSTKMFLPKGTDVIPIAELARMSGAFAFNPTMKDGKAGYDLSKLAEQQSRENAMLIRAVKEGNKQTEVHLKGVFDSYAWGQYVDNNFRH